MNLGLGLVAVLRVGSHVDVLGLGLDGLVDSPRQTAVSVESPLITRGDGNLLVLDLLAGFGLLGRSLNVVVGAVGVAFVLGLALVA